MITNSFFADFTENITGQYDECKGYKLLCDSQKFNPYHDLKEESDVEKVPFVTTTLFKKSNKLYRHLLRVDPETLEKWTVSSSTSGDPSIVGRNASDIAEIKEMVKLDGNVFKPKYGFDCVFFPEPGVMRRHDSEKLMGKPTESYIGNLLNIFDFSDETIFLLDEEGDSFSVNVKDFIKFIKTHDGKNDSLSIRGSTLLFYNTLQELKGKIPPINLGNKAIVHTGGGGWDGRKGNISSEKKIERHHFVEEVSEFLGIPRENFIDTYSFTENSTPLTGHYCEDFHDYLFHVPKWGKVIIRDIKTFEPLHEAGDSGFIQVLNAHGTSSFAGASVLVDDMGKIVSNEKCPGCGCDCMTIRIIGRVKGAEAKGCGATLKTGGNDQ